MDIKKKVRFDFYKSVQRAGFHTLALQEHLGLGLEIPENEAGQVLMFIDNLGSSLKAIHDQISARYAQQGLPT